MEVATLFENDDYLIVNKPYDMYINSEDENEKNTITCHIGNHDSHHSNSLSPIHFVHRLDFATSGVICLAKNRKASAVAGKLFEKRETRKYYIAVVRNHFDVDLCDIEYPVTADPLTADSSHKMIAVMSPTNVAQPRPAHTKLLVLETGFYGEEPVSVVLMKPITGRRHQLRVHCSAIGHTILGDYTYSNKEDSAPHRMFLHAARLVLPLPKGTLDIQTSEPFFSDQRFVSKWRPLRMINKYRSKEEFLKVCDVTDQPIVIGVKYHLFQPN